MNKVILMGRLTRDPDMRYTQGDGSIAIAHFTLAVDRCRTNADGNKDTDFIGCVAFGKSGEFAERYLHKGTKIALTGRIQTGSYTDRNGRKIYTTDVVAEEMEFAENKRQNDNDYGGGANGQQNAQSNHKDQWQQSPIGEGFMNIPDGIEDEGLPFN